jgi:hypothetical protein
MKELMSMSFRGSVLLHRSGALATLLLVWVAVVALQAGCGDDGPAEPGASGDRPQLTVVLHDDSMDAPSRTAGGLVDVTLQAADGKFSHHVAFFRLNDGVTYDELLAAPEGEDDGMYTFRGGNGTLLPGQTAHLTLDLTPGDYAVRDLGEENIASAELVVEGDGSKSSPAALGTTTLGPGMTIGVPDDFRLNGVAVYEHRRR